MTTLNRLRWIIGPISVGKIYSNNFKASILSSLSQTSLILSSITINRVLGMSAQMSLEERVERLEDRVAEIEDLVSGSTLTKAKTSLESHLDTVLPGTHVERATAIAYFLVHEDEENPFTVADVESGYEKCRTPKPANLSDVLNGAEERGWLMRTGMKGRNQLWTITRDGDKAVESGFEQ